MCPLSNVKLAVVPDLAAHPLRRMLELGLCVTVNSDDPAYFGGYVAENYRATAAALGLTDDDLLPLARNSFAAAFLDDADARRPPRRDRRVRRPDRNRRHSGHEYRGADGDALPVRRDVRVPDARGCSLVLAAGCASTSTRPAPDAPAAPERGRIRRPRSSATRATRRPIVVTPYERQAFLELAMQPAVGVRGRRAVLERWTADPTLLDRRHTDRRTTSGGSPRPAQRWSLITGRHLTIVTGPADVAIHFVPRAQFAAVLGVDHVDPTAVGLTRVTFAPGPARRRSPAGSWSWPPTTTR